MLMDGCFWVSTADGFTCAYDAKDSTALNMDAFQEELRGTVDNKFTLCAINVNAGSDFHSIVSSSVLDTAPPAIHVRSLLKLILQDNWHDSSDEIERRMAQFEERSPAQLAWTMKLPSDAEPLGVTFHQKPSLLDTDITLEWLREFPTFDTLFGSHDWSIYVSEPYNQRPKLDALRIICMTSPGTGNCRTVILTNSGITTKSLKQRHDDCVRSGAIDVASSAEDHMSGVLLVGLKVVILEIGRYIEGSVTLIQQLVG
jgi:hypothetical protein